MKKLKVILSSLLIAASLTAFAQTGTVTGTVKDAASGDAVAGATVLLKGSSSVYALTDALGGFSIKVPSDGVLVVSCLGYTGTEVAVAGRKVLNIALNTETTRLEDVIVVAYGTVRREANTGSVASVKGEELAIAPVTSVDKMLSGKMAGVTVTSGSGQPGSTSAIRIRGTSSINADNEPLWVIDGIPMMASDFRGASSVGIGDGSSTTFLNPNDIESITVLKDAAAASVYGSRAANGVILVTTKSGRNGKAKFTARVKFGGQQLINDNNLRPLTGSELLEYRRVSAINAGYNPDDPTSPYYFPYSLLQNGTTNWYKELTKTGTIQEYEVNATAGNEKMNYYASVSYHKNDGVFYGQDYQRFTARVNADVQLLKKLKTGVRINLSYTDSNSGQMGDLYYSNPQVAMFRILPWTPLRNADGSFNLNISENSDTNPRADAVYDDYNDKSYRINASTYLEWKPIKQLTLKTTNAVEYVTDYSHQYWSDVTNKGTATAFNYYIKDIRYTTSNTITYADTFGKHNVRLLAGQEAMMDTYDYLYAYSPGVDPQMPYPNTSAAADDYARYNISEETLLSFFGILDYNFDNRYFLQASFRRDGSSLFGSDRKWGNFWSVGGSWNISREKFMSGASGWLSQLKLRASYGLNGNNSIANYRSYGVYSAVQYNGAANAMVSSRPANPTLSWEYNSTWNAGLDFGFFDDRLTGSIDVYNRRTKDMLLNAQVPYTTGFGSNLKNIGEIENKGVEILLDGTLIKNRDFLWTLGFNISFNRSKVLDLAGSEFLTVTDSRANSNDDTPVRIVKGMSLYNFYLRDWYGVNPSNGDGLWWSEDGKLTNDRTKARYIYCGSPEPKATGGFNTEFSWKGLTLGAYFEFVCGNKVVTSNNYIDDGYDMTVNTSTAALNYWKKPGDTGVSPRPVAANPGAYYVGYSTRFLEDGSYLRIRDITLSYSLPENLMKKFHMSGIKFYVSALNPYTFHNVTAMDPELGIYGYTMGAAHSMVKSFVGGIEVSF